MQRLEPTLLMQPRSLDADASEATTHAGIDPLGPLADRPRPRNHDAPGLPLDRIAAVVEAVEEL